ncbi:kinase-like domain-containing protein [Rhizophagus clarus]|uniref:Kinase-like domain-containing protein n=1 Tax=Rhizophagus clarus TaxID=94130 RepID=A0A8H3LYV7_9GLOM|nr:kinase-like domain-containing protein [Rhizophagus clarus]
MAADKEHSFVQNNLGILYLEGEGTTKDLKKAIYWFYIKASKNGNEIAQYNLGECFEYGIGIEKNYQRAFYFYNKSVENGNIEANFQLGYIYINGIGIEINKEIV